MLSSEEIIERLKGKGMSFADEESAKSFFEKNSYYRFRGYFFDYLDKNNICQKHGKKFIKTISFDEIESRLIFDERLKESLFTATKHIELTLREQIVIALGKYGDTGYLNRKNYKSKQGKKFRKNFYKLKRRIKTLFRRSRAPFLKGKKLQEVPIWRIIEALDFGCLSTFLKLMKAEDVEKISNFFGYKKLSDFRSHIMLVNIIRNNCAHHYIFWNRKSSGKKPFRGMLGLENYKSSTYNDICILFHLTKDIDADWLSSIYFPYIIYAQENSDVFLDLTDGYDFPVSWYEGDMWKRSKLIHTYLGKMGKKEQND